MDIIKDISESGSRDIIVSLSRERAWLDYLSYFMELRVDNQNFNVIVDNTPKSTSGKKCYITSDGFLRGHMEIYKIREVQEGEVCIELIPLLKITPHKVKMPEIIGYKYYYDNFNAQ